MKLRPQLVLFTLGLATATTACGKITIDGTGAAGSASGEGITLTPPSSGAAQADDKKADDKPAAAAGEAYKLVSAPTAADVPAGPVKGLANGAPMQIKTVVFEPGFKSWRVILMDKELKSFDDFGSGAQSVNIDLPEEPGAGKKFSKALKYGDGYFQIASPSKPGSTTSWNADNAYYVEITKWDAKPYDPKGKMWQEAGKASGKIYVAYKGGWGGFVNSGVAGTFEDAIVRYMGTPYWAKKK
jgi:hypothetical protein